MTDKLCSAAIILGFTLCFIAACLDAKSDPIPLAKRIDPGQVELVASKVRAILSLQGFDAPSPTLPPLYLAPLQGYAGMVVDGAIVISSRQPEECAPVIFAHEYSHYILAMSAAKMVPEESEILARQVERLATGQYLPNCESPL